MFYKCEKHIKQKQQKILFVLIIIVIITSIILLLLLYYYYYHQRDLTILMGFNSKYDQKFNYWNIKIDFTNNNLKGYLSRNVE